MIRFLILIIFCTTASFAQTQSDPNCNHGSRYENICCSLQCSTEECGSCSNNQFTNRLCCQLEIENSSLWCNESLAPCILYERTVFTDPSSSESESNSSSESDVEDFFEKFFTGYYFEWTWWAWLIFGAICTLILVWLIYLCCCFGKRDPPVPYSHIVDKYD